MRQIVLDTETTGLSVEQGHRVIEIGCVELRNRRRTNRTFHHYLQPDREIDPGAQEVHGISAEMLAGKPRFAQVAREFVEFVADAELIIHNAPFDLGFLDAELQQVSAEFTGMRYLCRVVDTLAEARRMHPGQRNSLDALCKRYSVDNGGREHHGALLDAQLLADVYLAMTGGQGALVLNPEEGGTSPGAPPLQRVVRDGLHLVLVTPSAEEWAEHARYLTLIDQHSSGQTLWRRSDGET